MKKPTDDDANDTDVTQSASTPPSASGVKLDPRAQWPGRTEAARRLKMTNQRIRTLEASGELTPAMVNGVHRFDPEMLEHYAALQATAPIAVNAGDVVAQASRGMAQAYAHNEKILELLVTPIDKIVGTMTTQTDRLFARVQELEKRATESAEQWEKARAADYERQRTERLDAATAKRLDSAAAGLVRLAPLVATYVAAKAGAPELASALRVALGGAAPPSSPPAAAAPAASSPAVPASGDGDGGDVTEDEARDVALVLGVVEGLTDEQLALLDASGLVNADQRAAIDRVRAVKSKPDAATPAP